MVTRCVFNTCASGLFDSGHTFNVLWEFEFRLMCGNWFTDNLLLLELK